MLYFLNQAPAAVSSSSESLGALARFSRSHFIPSVAFGFSTVILAAGIGALSQIGTEGSFSETHRNILVISGYGSAATLGAAFLATAARISYTLGQNSVSSALDRSTQAWAIFKESVWPQVSCAPEGLIANTLWATFWPLWLAQACARCR